MQQRLRTSILHVSHFHPPHPPTKYIAQLTHCYNIKGQEVKIIILYKLCGEWIEREYQGLTCCRECKHYMTFPHDHTASQTVDGSQASIALRVHLMVAIEVDVREDHIFLWAGPQVEIEGSLDWTVKGVLKEASKHTSLAGVKWCNVKTVYSFQGRTIGPNTKIKKLAEKGGTPVKLRVLFSLQNGPNMPDGDLLSILNQ